MGLMQKLATLATQAKSAIYGAGLASLNSVAQSPIGTMVSETVQNTGNLLTGQPAIPTTWPQKMLDTAAGWNGIDQLPTSKAEAQKQVAQNGGKLKFPMQVAGLAGTLTPVTPISYFHATDANNVNSIKENGFKGTFGERSMKSKGSMESGVFLYPDNPGAAETFGKNFSNPAVIEASVNGKMYNANTQSDYGWEDRLQIQEIASNKKIINQLKNDGYVGVTSTESEVPASFVFKPDALSVKRLPSSTLPSHYPSGANLKK